jgi:hypothetical protein
MNLPHRQHLLAMGLLMLSGVSSARADTAEAIQREVSGIVAVGPQISDRQQVLANGRVLAVPFSAERIATLLPSIEDLVYEVVTGVLSPRQGAESLVDLEARR